MKATSHFIACGDLAARVTLVAYLSPVDLREAAPFGESRDGALFLGETGGLVLARLPLPFEREPLFAGVRRTESEIALRVDCSTVV